MIRCASFISLVVSLLVLSTAGALVAQPSIDSTSKQSVADIRIHYLGHSSFILAFDNGVTFLIDYGKSRSYDLDSPIYDLGDFKPTVVIYSHHDLDHDRGMKFDSATVLNGKDLSLDGITIKAIRVSERSEGDNFGYLITYKGYTIFHAGDSQGDIVKLSSSDEIQKRLRDQLPKKIDLLLAPIDWMRKIVTQAVAYVGFLQPRRVIPMHYWSPSIKSEFLEGLRSSDNVYDIVKVGGSDYDVFVSEPVDSEIKVISLTPSSYEK